MSNNKNNNDNFLGPSLAQGQVFRKQQQTRILTNNDVVTGNTARDQNKNKVSKHKNGKTTMSTIEPFAQKNALNGNSNDNYAPVSKKDIARDDELIIKKNQSEKEKTKDTISSYSQLSNALNKFQQGVTDEAKTYNKINKTPSLLNKNYKTADSKTIRVNNAGVINTLSGVGLQENPPITPGINISSSIANPPPDINYIPVKNIPSGSTSGTNTGLYSEQTSSTQIKMPKGISGYNLEGQNVYVLYPYPNGTSAINENMCYLGVFNNLTNLSPDTAISSSTSLVGMQRAIDKGFNVCGMTEYNPAGSSGITQYGDIKKIGNITPENYAYDVRSVAVLPSELNFPTGQGYNMLTFAADGILYAGNSSNNFAFPMTKSFSSDLHPFYGGTINNLVASYAYNQGKWKNLQDFSGNSDPTGQPSGTFNTLYQHDIEVKNIGFQTEYYYNWLWGQQSYQVPYIYYTTQTETELPAPNLENGNLVYINYNCGNRLGPNAPTNVGNINAGHGFNVDCSDLYSQYPSFMLTLSDIGQLTISNSNTRMSSPVVKYDIPYGYPSTATLSNGVPITLNMPRNIGNDETNWVNNSKCINNGGGPLVVSSKIIQPILEGNWISSPNGFCRLILTGGNLQLQYSLQNVSQDADGNFIGNGSSIALYSIQNANALNLALSAHIDINGALNPYDSSMITYDNNYTEIKGYIPNPNVLNQSTSKIVQNANDEQCRIACNNDPDCAGYVIYGNCNLLTSENVFPTGDRIPNPGYSTYIRNPMFPHNDNSCRKTLDAVTDTEAYSYYLNNGITPSPPNPLTPMTTKTKCNLGKVIEGQMSILQNRNKDAVEKGKIVKNQFSEIFQKENNILNSISDNRDISKFIGDVTKKATDKIQSIENSQITKLASEKDSELLLISNNYKYVLWGIGSLLLSIATIKGLRVASS